MCVCVCGNVLHFFFYFSLHLMKFIIYFFVSKLSVLCFSFPSSWCPIILFEHAKIYFYLFICFPFCIFLLLLLLKYLFCNRLFRNAVQTLFFSETGGGWKWIERIKEANIKESETKRRNLFGIWYLFLHSNLNLNFDSGKIQNV